MEDRLTGVAHDRSEVVTIVGAARHPSMRPKVFRAVADADVSIDMVLQERLKGRGRQDTSPSPAPPVEPAAVEKTGLAQKRIGFSQLLCDDHIGKGYR